MTRYTKYARYLTVALIGLVLMRPALAWAHARLTRSEPAARERLAVAPTAIRLWFSEAPEIAMTRIALADSAGRAIQVGRVERGDSKLGVRATIIAALAPGRYVVSWRTAAADGHPSAGTIAFVVLPSATATIPAAVPPPARDTVGAMPASASPMEMKHPAAESTALTATYIVVRAMTFISLLIVVGCVVFRVGVIARTVGIDGWLRDSLSARTARLGMYAALVAFAACLARLDAQARMMRGDGDSFHLGTMVMDTQWGTAWLIQCVTALCAALAFWVAAQRYKRAWGFASVAAVVLAFSPALGGHAVASPQFMSLAVLTDGLHVFGAAGWLGSLTCVVVVGLPVARTQIGGARWRTIASLVNAFSPAALSFAALAALTGVVSAWLRLGALAPLWTSTYGQVLLLKLGLLAGVAGTGAYNWLRVRPSLGTEAATLHLRRSASTELTIGCLVLVVTAILVAVPTSLDGG